MDDIKFKNIGYAVRKKNILRAVYSKGLFYTVISGGEVAKLAVIDTATLKVLKLLELDGAIGAWSLTMGNSGCIYAGTYYNGRLYKYDPVKDLLEDLGQPVPEQSFIWDMTAGKDTKIYGGTYPGCRAFEYNEENGKSACLGGRIVENEDYVRSITIDNDAGELYIGVASHPHMIKYSLKDNKKVELTPEKYKNKSCILDIDSVSNRIFAIIGNDLIVIDKATGLVENSMADTISISRGVSGLSPDGSSVYFTANHTLYMYDIKKKAFQSLNIDTQDEFMGFGFDMDNKSGYEGGSLVGLTKEGVLFRYGLRTGKHMLSEIPELPAQPVDIQTIKKGPDGNIYCSGYLLGGMAAYSPENGAIVQYEGIKQVEGMCVIGDRMFFGKYPGSEIYEYNASAKWDARGTLPNPKKLFDLRKDYAQDRTFAMAGMEDKGLLFIGSVPEYGKLGGVLAEYDIDTGALKVYNNIVSNQSIVSLACRGNEVFGGTSVWGGLGQKPTEKEAKFFVWDAVKRQKTFETVPVGGMIAITSLIRAADDNIWGLAGGTLFIFDTVSRKIIYTSELFKADYISCGHIWRDAFMENGPDNNIYGVVGYSTTGGKFFCINAITRKLYQLADINLSGMTKDDKGDFYFIDRKSLLKAHIGK